MVSGGVNRFPWTGLQNRLAVAGSQVNAFTWAGDMQVTGTDPSLQNVFNVKDYGAVGNGTHDDTSAFRDAAAGLFAGGGVLFIPPGEYLLSDGTMIPSNTAITGGGAGNTRLVASSSLVDPGGNENPAYSFFYNENWGTPGDPAGPRDENISVSGIMFDYSWRANVDNAFASLKFRHVTRLYIQENYFFWGGNSIAIRGSDRVWVEGNNSFGFSNASWDFWEGPGTTFILNNYAETANTRQFINFNPDYARLIPGDYVAKQLIIRGNVLKYNGAVSSVCLLEQIGDFPRSDVNMIVDGNLFLRVFLAARGEVYNLAITNNIFDDFPDGGTNIIRVHPLYGNTPKGVVISNNVIRDPGTAAGQFGVIWCEADDAIVTGNVVTGTTYTGEPFNQGTKRPLQYGNFFEKLAVTGRIQQGFIITNPNDVLNNFRSCIAWEDTFGAPLRMYMEDDFHQAWSTGATGLPRAWWSLQGHSDAANWTILIPSVFTRMRQTVADGLTATGTTSGTALQLTLSYAEVTTTPAGTGVRLPLGGASPLKGLEVTVWNAGANPLNVYPMAGGQIGALGADIPDTIAAGADRTYVAITETLYRIKT